MRYFLLAATALFFIQVQGQINSFFNPLFDPVFENRDQNFWENPFGILRSTGRHGSGPGSHLNSRQWHSSGDSPNIFGSNIFSPVNDIRRIGHELSTNPYNIPHRNSAQQVFRRPSSGLFQELWLPRPRVPNFNHHSSIYNRNPFSSLFSSVPRIQLESYIIPHNVRPHRPRILPINSGIGVEIFMDKGPMQINRGKTFGGFGESTRQKAAQDIERNAFKTTNDFIQKILHPFSFLINGEKSPTNTPVFNITRNATYSTPLGNGHLKVSVIEGNFVSNYSNLNPIKQNSSIETPSNNVELTPSTSSKDLLKSGNSSPYGSSEQDLWKLVESFFGIPDASKYQQKPNFNSGLSIESKSGDATSTISPDNSEQTEIVDFEVQKSVETDRPLKLNKPLGFKISFKPVLNTQVSTDNLLPSQPQEPTQQEPKKEEEEIKFVDNNFLESSNESDFEDLDKSTESTESIIPESSEETTTSSFDSLIPFTEEIDLSTGKPINLEDNKFLMPPELNEI